MLLKFGLKGGLLFAACLVLGAAIALPARPAHSEQINVAITDFAGADYETGKMVSQIIQGALSSIPGVMVVDRTNLEDILRQQRLNISGFVDMSSLSGGEVGQLCQVGQLVGATHLVTGSFTRDSRSFVLTINLVSITTGTVQDSAVATASYDDYLNGILTASNRFANKMAGKGISPDQLFGKLELITNVEWAGQELLVDPRNDLKLRIEQATGLPVASRDITGGQSVGAISSVFKDDIAIESNLKGYAIGGGMNPILLVDFLPVAGPSSGGWYAYKARMYWAAYYPMLGGAVVHGQIETSDFGKGLTGAQAVSQAVQKSYDLFASDVLYKIVGNFGFAGKRNVTVKIAGTKKQDHLSLKSTIMDALGVTAFSKDLFTSGVCTYTFEWAGSMDQIKQALLDTQKVFFVEMDNDSITFKRVV